MDPLTRDRPHDIGCSIRTLGRAQDVLEVDVAERRALGIHDHIPREAVSGDCAFDLGRRDRLGKGDELRQRHRDVARLLVGELERGRDRSGGVVEDALDARLVDDRRDLFERERRSGLILRLDAGQTHRMVGDPVQGHDHRVEQARYPDQRRREHEHSAVGHREREVLRHHLAEHDVQVRDQQQRHEERDHIDRALGEIGQTEGPREQVMDRRLGDVQDQQRADRDAQLARCQHEGRMLHGVQRGLGRARPLLGERLDLRPARGDDGELGADEEGVEGQQHDQPGDSGPIAHDRSPPSVCVPSGIGVGVNRTRSTRRPSMRCTSSVPSSMWSASPTAGMRSSTLMM